MATLKDIIREIKVDGLTKAQKERVIKEFLAVLREKVASGEKVKIRGFGTFYLHKPQREKAFAPALGKWVKVTPKPRIKFKASKSAL